MGLHVESSIGDYWNTEPIKGPIHDQVLRHISLKRWQQIDRFFHISKPQQPGQPSNERPFAKLEPLSDTLRQAFKKYWKTGTHLAVDESIQRFMGRAKEIVNIPSKPTPEGFKIWILANEGYVLDWIYHSKGTNYSAGEGPYDMCDFWTDDLGFDHPAPAREHERLERMGDKAKYCVVCLNAGRSVPNPAKIRKPLMELSNNSVRPSDPAIRKRRQRPPRGLFGYKLCGIHICNHMGCWNEHIAAIPK